MSHDEILMNGHHGADVRFNCFHREFLHGALGRESWNSGEPFVDTCFCTRMIRGSFAGLIV